MQVTYSIKDFDWSTKAQLLSADASSLWALEDYQFPFPNGRKQFFVTNNRTKGFRRFRLLVALKHDLLFVSEDEILCLIKNVNNFS